MTDEEINRKCTEFVRTITDRPVVLLFGVQEGVRVVGNCAENMKHRKYFLLKSFHAAIEEYGRQRPQQPGINRN